MFNDEVLQDELVNEFIQQFSPYTEYTCHRTFHRGYNNTDVMLENLWKNLTFNPSYLSLFFKQIISLKLTNCLIVYVKIDYLNMKIGQAGFINIPINLMK